MGLKNKLADELIKKDKNISQKAAKIIIDSADLEAWLCLVENADYILDFIKRNAAQKLYAACNSQNVQNLFSFLDYHSSDFDETVALAFLEYGNESTKQKLLELLKNGTNQQKAYAAKFFCFTNTPEARDFLFEESKSDYKPLSDVS